VQSQGGLAVRLPCACRARLGAQLENSQDPKRIRTVQDFLQRKFIIEPHFAGRKSLM
jgi:hypothetical protein